MTSTDTDTNDGRVFESKTARYIVERTLDRGGQGITHLVRDADSGDELVLKELRFDRVDDWKALELFEREVEVLASIDHPGIPRLVDRIVDEDDERTVAIVQTRVHGETLQALMERGPMSPERFESTLRQCLHILAHLQSRVPPVIHRDINPSNIMLDGNDRAWLIDFGAVRVGGATSQTSVGTFGFMAPEQIIGRPTPASDMYSLGMTFAALASRRDPDDFPIDDKTGHVDVAQMVDAVREPLRTVLIQMTRAGTAERLDDPAEALRRLDRRHVPAPRQPSAVANQTQPGSKSARPMAAVVAFVAVALLAGLGALVFLMARPNPDVEVSSEVSVPAEPAVERVETSAEDPTHEALVRQLQEGGHLPPGVTVLPPGELPPGTVAPPTPSGGPIGTTTVVVTDDPPEPVPSEVEGANVTVKSEPEGAKVFADGELLGETPLVAPLPYGKHQLTLELEGKKLRREVNVLDDTTLSVAF